jgi:hypothetical protein
VEVKTIAALTGTVGLIAGFAGASYLSTLRTDKQKREVVHDGQLYNRQIGAQLKLGEQALNTLYIRLDHDWSQPSFSFQTRVAGENVSCDGDFAISAVQKAVIKPETINCTPTQPSRH